MKPPTSSPRKMSRVSVCVLPLALTMSGCFLFTPPDVSEDEFDMSAPPSMDQGMEEEEDQSIALDHASADASMDMPEASADLDQGAVTQDMPPAPPADWQAIEHTHRVRLSPHQDLALPDEELVVLVRLDSQRIDFELLAPQGKDLLFVSNDGAELSHEVEFFSKELERADIWVKYPAPKTAEPSPIWMYFGEPSPRDKQDPEGLWANYEVVHHFSRFDPETQFPQDTSEHEAHPYRQSEGLLFELEGISGLAPRFRKDEEDFIRFHKDLQLGTGFGEQRVYELWFKADTIAVLEGMPLALVADEGSCRGFSAFYGDGGNPLTVSARLFYATDEASGCESMERGTEYISYRDTSAETWHHLALVIDRPDSRFEVWIDGTRDLPHSIKTSVPQNAFTLGYELMLGHSFVPTARSFIGVLDEFRVWNGVRSEAWFMIQDRIGRDQFFIYGQPQSWK